ncbi:MAG: helix-turn-helix domain-containing protein [Actinomycetota bacterium]|nr:helix-turn-helix domain-containing protein [Actinomycetota bacterium]
MADWETPVGEICKALGISRSTLYRHAGKREG